MLVFAKQELLEMVKAFFLLLGLFSLFVGGVDFLNVVDELLGETNGGQQP